MFLSIMALVTVFVLYGIYLLVKVADDINYTGNSYEKLIYLVMKEKWIKGFAEWMLVALQLVVCVGGILFSVKLLNFSMCLGKVDALCDNTRLITLIAFLISVPTYFVKDFRFFSNLTLMSSAMVLILVGTITWKAGRALAIRGPAVQGPIDWSKLPGTFSLCAYALEGIGIIIPVKNSMQEQNKFWNLTLVAVIGVAIFYSIPAVVLSEAFGVATKQVVLNNLIEYSPLVHALSLVYIGCIFMTYTINLFPVYTIMLNSTWSRDYIGSKDLTANPERPDRIKKVMIISRIICMLIIFFVSISGPNLVPFLSIAGAIFIATFGYFFPVLLYNTHFGRQGTLTKTEKFLSYLFLIVMGGISVFTVVDGVKNLFAGHTNSLH